MKLNSCVTSILAAVLLASRPAHGEQALMRLNQNLTGTGNSSVVLLQNLSVYDITLDSTTGLGSLKDQVGNMDTGTSWLRQRRVLLRAQRGADFPAPHRVGQESPAGLARHPHGARISG